VEGKQSTSRESTNKCRVFVAGCPSCLQLLLKASTGPNPFFNHQQTPEVRDVTPFYVYSQTSVPVGRPLTNPGKRGKLKNGRSQYVVVHVGNAPETSNCLCFLAGFTFCRMTSCWKYWLRRETRWQSSHISASASMLSQNWSLEPTSSKWNCRVVCCNSCYNLSF